MTDKDLKAMLNTFREWIDFADEYPDRVPREYTETITDTEYHVDVLSEYFKSKE